MEAPSKYHPIFATTGCLGQVFQFLGNLLGFGQREQVSPVVVNQQVPKAPPAPPIASADAPMPDDKQSGELEDARADKTGFGALIIPRTAFTPITRNVPSG